MNVKLLREGVVKTMTDYKKTLPDACTLFGAEFKFSRRFGKHSNYLLCWTINIRGTVENIFIVEGVLEKSDPDNTLYSQKTYTASGTGNNAYYLTMHSMLKSFANSSRVLRCDFEYQYNQKIRFVFHVSGEPGISIRWSADSHDTSASSKSSLLQPVEHCMLPFSYHPILQKARVARKHAEHFIKTGYTVQEETLADHFVEYRHNRALQLETAQRWSWMDQTQRKTLLQSLVGLIKLRRSKELPNELIAQISSHVCGEIKKNTSLDRIYLPIHVLNSNQVLLLPYTLCDNADYSLDQQHVHVLWKHLKRLQHDKQQLYHFINFKRDPVKLYDERLKP